MGAFSGVENAKMRGSSPEMLKTGSPLAKGELNEEKKEGNHPPQREIDQRDPNQGAGSC